MIFELLTIFPEMLESYLSASMMKRAQASGAADFTVRNIRDYALDKHRVTDDVPFGGGPGMVMKPEPVAGAIEAARAAHSTPLPVVYLSPQGRVWNQQLAREFSQLHGIILLCGRYEGLDERVIERYVDEEISIGDFVLTGGELPALVMLDSIVRLLPGVLGNNESAEQDSFGNDGLLDCPHYTRPETWNGQTVPAVLRSGHHANITAWRRMMAFKRTRDRRPDIFEKFLPSLSKADKKLLARLEAEERGEEL